MDRMSRGRDWARMEVAPGGTHHLVDGEPAYADRFDEVLRFHAPGLAPVRRAGLAWHIDPLGRDAHGRRFLRTFGFYEDRSAVISSGGWHHVLPGGEDAYAARYAWCGNYQHGRCTVREADGRYLHLALDGQPAYLDRWWYAGDYREGAAVVQAEDGRSTHVDPSGAPVHGRWFIDLDVFHKGLARARDEGGWMHVDRAGRPVYSRRFAAVEPFYNGQARCEESSGLRVVIDEAGETVRALRP